MGIHIGFVSTRFAGTDGVTLEAIKWAEILQASGHECFWFAGELDREEEKSYLSPEAHFQNKYNVWINERIVGQKKRVSAVTEAIHSLRMMLKADIYQFVEEYGIDLLIVENALTIPMHVPLGIAIAEFIAETQMPTIAHHHDFYWERDRFSINAVSDYLHMAFPPNLPDIEHVVINSAAQEQLALRKGISSSIIPNVLDFENTPPLDLEMAKKIRDDIGLAADDVMILQPTRIVQRKGIEHTIELIRALDDPRYKLIISHEAGDEGFEYADWLTEHASSHGVDLRLLKTQPADVVTMTTTNHTPYSLWDIYPAADFITYPSLYEGFGNAFLEAIYFKKPILINRYATFIRDIEPKGFDLIVMNGFLTRKTAQKVKDVLESPERMEQMVSHNYETARRFYSYAVPRRNLNALITMFFGEQA